MFELDRRHFLSAATGLGGAAMLIPALQSSALGGVISVADASQASQATDISKLPRVKQKMVAPPMLPIHEQVASGGPKVVEV
ncbi:MAG: nitrite reductase, copper-containing, partial [Alphaproteobacteria bacterium]